MPNTVIFGEPYFQLKNGLFKSYVKIYYEGYPDDFPYKDGFVVFDEEYEYSVTDNTIICEGRYYTYEIRGTSMTMTEEDDQSILILKLKKVSDSVVANAIYPTDFPKDAPFPVPREDGSEDEDEDSKEV